MEHQKEALGALTRFSRNELKTWEEEFKKTDHIWKALRMPEKFEGTSLPAHLSVSLDLETPLILKFYAPLIRLLRSRETADALDFYIIVKAHVTRLMRIIQSFAGDPALIKRSSVLL